MFHELAQLSLCEWRCDILKFVDLRWCALKVVSSTVINSLRLFSVRPRTLLFAKCVEDFLCMHKKSSTFGNNSQYAEGSFTKCNMQTGCVSER